MSITEVPAQCDECGRGSPKIHRLYKGHRYCASCYARVFKPRSCPRCNIIARPPKDDPSAQCRRCALDIPCLRCGKAKYAMGRITLYGQICNACSAYFREERACTKCGQLSRLLSRSSRFGEEEQICPACQRVDHGICFLCR